jgi:two-component system, NarL family, sensor kinase
VYRTAQEALQNVAKHASAQTVRVRLHRHKDRVVLEVADDGSGFDSAAAALGGPAGPTGFGLSGMRERAELLGGRLELTSAPGRGTTVRLSIPFLPAAQSRG